MDLSQLIASDGRSPKAWPAETRPVWFGGWVDTPCYWRDALPLDPGLTGPCVIEQMDTTIIIDPGCKVSGDADGNLIVTVPHD
jgi:N-methylhydantoinase A